MNTTRQDAWTKDEDVLLAETVLRYIREGKTQLEAFKEVAKKLSRTSAACGFRWNATIRKEYHNAIQFAKEARKQNSQRNMWNQVDSNANQENDPIDTAILLLKKMKINTVEKSSQNKKENLQEIKQLKKENEELKAILLRYEEAWKEMNKLWNWIKEKNYE